MWQDTPDDGTLLAFDFGTKSIGVAVGQPLPAPLVLCLQLKRRTVRRTEHYRAFTERVAAGRNHRRFALNMDGTEQPLTARARKFANLFMVVSVLK